MEIAITNDTYIKEIQDGFQKEFPFLKVEFFKTIHRNGSPLLKALPISGKMMVSMVRHLQNEGTLNIEGSRSVEDLEKDFQNKFGLYAQIFRKSGSMWIETTLTDHWSLQRQNLEGQQLSWTDTP